MKILFLGPSDLRLIKWIKKQENEVVVKNDKFDINFLKKNHFDFIISYGYRYLIEKNIINFSKKRIINLHLSFLPWNRGADPNIWSFVDNTPKGVSIHLVNEGLDKGDILVQKEIFFDLENETLKSSYEKLHRLLEEIFKENWSKIKDEKIKPEKQKGKGSYHNIKDKLSYNKLLSVLGWETKVKSLKNITHEDSRI